MMATLPEHIVKKCLGKAASKSWRHILCDIEAVSTGIKPCFLYDYSSIEPMELSETVAKLVLSGLIAKNGRLQVLSLEQDAFLANIPCLQTVLEQFHRALEESRLVAVDVSACLEQPCLLREEAIQQLKEHTGDILAQLRGADCKSEAVLKLTPKPGWNFTALFGVLLGYPVVYWYDDIDTASNCLSMVPLRVHTVTLNSDNPLSLLTREPANSIPQCQKLVPHTANNTGMDFSQSRHSLYSFSVPEALAVRVEDHIENWFRGIQERTHHKLQMTCSVVTLPTVAL